VSKHFDFGCFRIGQPLDVLTQRHHRHPKVITGAAFGRVESRGVSISAYAKREGLLAVSLYYWRKRLGLTPAWRQAMVGR